MAEKFTAAGGVLRFNHEVTMPTVLGADDLVRLVDDKNKIY